MSMVKKMRLVWRNKSSGYSLSDSLQHYAGSSKSNQSVTITHDVLFSGTSLRVSGHDGILGTARLLVTESPCCGLTWAPKEVSMAIAMIIMIMLFQSDD